MKKQKKIVNSLTEGCLNFNQNNESKHKKTIK